MTVAGSTREPGDPVPEAAGWPRLATYIKLGRIIEREAPKPAPVKAAAPPKPKKPKAYKPKKKAVKPGSP